MVHHIYHTRGLILSSSSIGESNRFYKIFTEDLGLVGASAQSVRVGKSKLRYVLQDFSWVTLDLVRGKEVWRLISAGEGRILPAIKGDSARLKLFASVCALISRLVHGEGRDEELFRELDIITTFIENEKIPEALELAFETLVSLRVLAHLGYLDPEPYKEFLSSVWSLDILESFEKIRTKTVPVINTALINSHL